MLKKKDRCLTPSLDPQGKSQKVVQMKALCVCVSKRAHAITSAVSDSVTAWTVACLAPLSMGFSSQEYWSGLPCPPPGDLPNPGIELTSLKSPALAGSFLPPSQ